MHEPDKPILTERQREVPQLRWVDTFSRVLDSKFRIPGTGVRFGLDFILGLVPGAGDILSLGLSGTLIATMARHGASPRLVARMLVNVVLDALVGSIPILGNIFDLVYKANYRNAELMREYYEEGKHRGSVWPVVVAVIVSILVLMVVLIWVIIELFEWLLSFF
ncbi:uncharacterized protein DUF4112 [Neolewinella xylanilytica]|uniref:Uncharacterized protein DUF4112 n=1 Tax=Neolewinella xylanilytica TaxID=1514080 RepID=A0A2S6I3B2_9BACT|nr:DUF4112 domain-containing protein [Neolewinella xylanilytica]PPK85668.1 uncharacterized protein DUF4112 [Neolewinella xylanilytica]